MHYFLDEFASLNLLPPLSVYIPSNTPMEEEEEDEVNVENVGNLDESDI